MVETGSDPGSYPIPPASVHLSPFSPPSARLLLSTHFTPRRIHPLQSPRRMDEASSAARSIGLSRDEALAWELFTPYQRVMIVAVIGAAAAGSKKNGVIRKLQKSVDLRDQVLTGMQQKLDDLCQQLSLAKVSGHDDDLESKFREKFGSENVKFVECGCCLCDHHHHSSPATQDKAPATLVVEAEQEERRMSYLSDWCSSVTSAAELHFDNLSLDQDMLSLRKECQEKDATIKDLTSFLQLTNKACSKRETELEEIVRRKKAVIKKLKRDVLVLEEKVTQLTRLQRSSYSATIPNTREFPMRVDNLLYDMDVSTASSSSDSDTPANTPRRTVLEDAPVVSIKEEPSGLEQTHKSAPAKPMASFVKSVKPPSVVSPLTTTRKPVGASSSASSSSSSSRMRGTSSAGDSKKPRRPIQVAPRASSGSHKRWV